MSADPAAYNVIPLDPHCDPRIDAFTKAIEAIVVERAVGKFPIVTVVGALQAVQWKLLANMYDDDE